MADSLGRSVNNPYVNGFPSHVHISFSAFACEYTTTQSSYSMSISRRLPPLLFHCITAFRRSANVRVSSANGFARPPKAGAE